MSALEVNNLRALMRWHDEADEPYTPGMIALAAKLGVEIPGAIVENIKQGERA